MNKIRLTIKTGTVVKIVLVATATKIAVNVAFEVATPYLEDITTKMKNRISKLREEDSSDQ